MTGVTTPFKPYSRRPTPALYDKGWLDQEHQNIGQAIASIEAQNPSGLANVLDYPGISGNDITRPILNAWSDTGAAWVPPGSWVTSANLTMPGGTSLYGIPWFTLITPSSALSNKEVFTLGSQTTLKGIRLSGVNTTGAIPVGAGNDQLISNPTASDLDIRNFIGTGARAVKLGRVVSGNFRLIYSASNEYGIECDGGDTPTNTAVDYCFWTTSVRKGTLFKTGIGVNFHSNLWQSNGEEGFYLANVGGTAIRVLIDGVSWFENNWTSVASGALRHANYDLFCDGANGPSGTIELTARDTYFNDSGTTARAMHLTNCLGYSVDNCRVPNEAGQILIDGTSYGKFENWPEQSGSFRTTVTAPDYNASAWNSRSHLEDNIETAWTAYTPTVTGTGGMTISALVVNKARYKVIGKTLILGLYLTFTTGTAGGPSVRVTLPTNIRTLASLYAAVAIDDGAVHSGITAPDTASPTSSLDVYHVDSSNWTLGANRAIYAVLTLELF